MALGPGSNNFLLGVLLATLVALGVLPPFAIPRDRLWQREHGEPGFAQPPRW